MDVTATELTSEPLIARVTAIDHLTNRNTRHGRLKLALHYQRKIDDCRNKN